MQKQWLKFSIDKVSEGGMGQKEAVRLLKEAGFSNVRRTVSPYVGQTAVEVEVTSEAQVRKIEDILY